jgi:hypothetical protein
MSYGGIEVELGSVGLVVVVLEEVRLERDDEGDFHLRCLEPGEVDHRTAAVVDPLDVARVVRLGILRHKVAPSFAEVVVEEVDRREGDNCLNTLALGNVAARCTGYMFRSRVMAADLPVSRQVDEEDVAEDQVGIAAEVPEVEDSTDHSDHSPYAEGEARCA